MAKMALLAAAMSEVNAAPCALSARPARRSLAEVSLMSMTKYVTLFAPDPVLALVMLIDLVASL
jgi:hypothetical protein